MYNFTKVYDLNTVQFEETLLRLTVTVHFRKK